MFNSGFLHMRICHYSSIFAVLGQIIYLYIEIIQKKTSRRTRTRFSCNECGVPPYMIFKLK